MFARARQELRFAFFQINAPQVTWKLARIPAEKLSTVTARVREFEKDATDPVTGKVVIDPRTGFAKQFQTELLVDAFQLPVSASGIFDATSGDVETRRDLHCAPPENETSLARIFSKQARACLTAGSSGIARSFEQRLSANAKTNADDRHPASGENVGRELRGRRNRARGHRRTTSSSRVPLPTRTASPTSRRIRFPEIVLTPKRMDVHLFIADTAPGPALQFADGTTYPPRERLPSVLTETARGDHYRSQSVSARADRENERDDARCDSAALTIPAATDVHWHVLKLTAIASSPKAATLSPYGGWEAEWKIPERQARQLRNSCSCRRPRLRRDEHDQCPGISRTAFSGRGGSNSRKSDNRARPRFLRLFSWRAKCRRARPLEGDVDNIGGIRWWRRRGVQSYKKAFQ